MDVTAVDVTATDALDDSTGAEASAGVADAEDAAETGAGLTLRLRAAGAPVP